MIVCCDQKLLVVLANNKAGSRTNLILSLIILTEQIIGSLALCRACNGND